MAPDLASGREAYYASPVLCQFARIGGNRIAPVGAQLQSKAHYALMRGDEPLPQEVITHELSHLSYRRFLPAVALRVWVQCFWSVRIDTRAAVVAVEKLYPDGGSTLSFDRRGDWQPLLHVESETRPERFDAVTERVGIRFEPGGLFQMFGIAPSEVAGSIVALDDICAVEVGRLETMALRESLARASTIERIELLERWLLVQASRVQPRVGRVQRMVPLLRAGEQEISALVGEQGLSRRTLERVFRREVGLTPGQVSQFHQLKRARQLLSQPALSISEVALACGFFDQAHFTHQFRHFTGETPAAYRRRKLTQIYKPPTGLRREDDHSEFS